MDCANGKIRIITLNTWKGDGQYDWRLQLMSRDLYTLMPDILCLQESVQSADRTIDTAGHLADYLKMELIYAPVRLKRRIIDNEEILCYSGLAILSRFPFDSSWITELPCAREDQERIAFSARLHTDIGLLTVSNIHLTHLAGLDDLRFEQFQSFLEKNSGEKSQSTWICCGDLNIHFGEKILSLYEKRNCIKITDCYLDGNGTQPGITLAGKSPDTVSPLHRIDHILHIHNNSTLQCNNAQVVLNEADFEGCYPSDHFGVSVDLLSQLPAQK